MTIVLAESSVIVFASFNQSALDEVKPVRFVLLCDCADQERIGGTRARRNNIIIVVKKAATIVAMGARSSDIAAPQQPTISAHVVIPAN